ncbi:MAG: type II secretion system protein [Verrucomicrobiota bacterium]
MTPAPATPLSRPRGFTLIELLVTIAIIGVLALIVTPVVSSSIKSSRVAKSLNNMRQIGMIVRMYSNENRGSIPSAWDNNTKKTWTTLVRDSEVVPPKDLRSVLVCPLMEAFNGDDNENSATSYAMNTYIGDRPSKPAYMGITNMAQAVNPSRTALLFNSFYYPTSLTWKYSASPGEVQSTILPADGNHVQVLFLDGSVGMIDGEDHRLYSLSTRGSASWMFWNGE